MAVGVGARGAGVDFVSVGAGAVGVTALLLLYPRLPMASIVGPDIAHAVPLTLVAGIGHWALGSVDWALMGVLLMGSLPGIVIGSYCAVRVPETVLGCCWPRVLILVAGKLAHQRVASGEGARAERYLDSALLPCPDASRRGSKTLGMEGALPQAAVRRLPTPRSSRRRSRDSRR